MGRDDMLRAARLAYWWAVANGLTRVSANDLTDVLGLTLAQVMTVIPIASMLVPGLEWTGKGVTVKGVTVKGKKVKGLCRPDRPVDETDFVRPADKKPKPSEVRGIYLYWLKATGRSASNTKLTRGRSAVIRARLGEKYTPAQLRSAIDGNQASDWHQGGNPDGKRWDDLTLILRSGEKVEYFIEMGGGGRKPPSRKPKGQTQTTTFSLDDIAMSAIIYGDRPMSVVVDALKRADLGKWLEPAASELGVSSDRLRSMVKGETGGGLL